MDPNFALDQRAIQAISTSIRKASLLTRAKLPDIPEGADTPAATTISYRGQAYEMRSMPFKDTLVDLLDEAYKAVWAGQTQEALNLLISTQAMCAAKIADIEIEESDEVETGDASEIRVKRQEIPGGPSGGGGPPGLLSSWWQKAKNWLGKLVSWIWKIIQTMLTPKGWSIGGGVTVHGLANAQLTINFGT